MRNCLVLSQYREESEYHRFIGKFYHFPANENKNYTSQFSNLPIEFVYYEPEKRGAGVFYGYGKINKPPFPDQRQEGYYFVEIDNYKPFTHPVFYKNPSGKALEALSPFYNPQNAVRHIPEGLMDGICLDAGLQLNFKADAHLIRVLGEQLIGSEKVGILELIKNSLDAEASYCRVRLESFPALPLVELSQYEFNDYSGPVIVIEDDGAGMTRQIIEDAWLRPATTFKTNIKERLKRERKKALEGGRLGTYDSIISELKRSRVPLGEKGVGRFATHRLGRLLEIHTKTEDVSYELVLRIDWNLFDQFSESMVDLDSIGVTLTRQAPSWKYSEKGSGTRLIIYGGREGFVWGETIVEDINRAILSLNSPNPQPDRVRDVFRVKLECPQLPGLPTEPLYKLYRPNFVFSAIVDEYGKMDYQLDFNPSPAIPLPKESWSYPNFDLRAADSSSYWLIDSQNPQSGLRKPDCGSFYIHLDVWYRDAEWIVGNADAKQLLDYLANHGGISIYRDNIVIYPAETGTTNDWLGLALRQIKQSFRMSYYHTVGNVEIAQIQNDLLVDKTNREGLIQNIAFDDLRKLVSTALTVTVEAQYIGKRTQYRELSQGIVSDPKKLGNMLKDNVSLVGNIRERYPVIEDPYALFDKIPSDERPGRLINLSSSLDSLRKSLQILESNQDLFTEWAGYGLSVAVAIHEIAKLTSNFYNGAVKLIEKDGLQDDVITNLKEASRSFRSELNRLGPLRAVRNERRNLFNVIKSIKYVKELYERTLRIENVLFEFNDEEDFLIWGRYTALNQILSNLVDNSVHWLGFRADSERKISITLNSRLRTITVADNGPGIQSSIRPYLFQPGISMKVPPSGLGLYICRYYMRDMGGDIYEAHERERTPRMTGAQFTLDFEKVPSSREQAKD